MNILLVSSSTLFLQGVKTMLQELHEKVSFFETSSFDTP